jgi:hypothetical protein
MRAVQKVTFGELLTKRAMRKNVLYTKNMCMLKLLFTIVIAGIEALVPGNKCSYACVNEVCHLCAQPCFDTFHQLFINVEAL